MNSVTRLLKRWVVGGADTAPAARPAPLLMPLEPRIVYDASIAALAVAAHHQLSAAGQQAEHVGAPERIGQSLAGRISPPPAEHRSPVPHRGGETRSIEREPVGLRQEALPLRDTPNAQRQVVFIDPSVSGYQELITGLPAGTHYVVLNPNTDGLEQIAQYLQQHPGIDAIHLISHGAEGQIQVGATWLNEGDLSAHSSELAQIGAAMRPGGDFLIYGCDVAEHTDGQGLVRQIAALTHLNVAASTDPTGAAALGGDWVLEYDAGTVHTSVIFSAAAERQYAQLLGVTNETFDSQLGYVTPGGASGVTSFTLDSFTYTLDQASEFAVDSTTVNQGGTPPLSTGPTDGVLFGNVQGTQLTWMTMSLSSGDKMAVQSFDIDTFGGAVSIEGLNASGTVVASTTANGSTSHVDLSANSAFSGIKTLKIVETDGSFLYPTLNNFSYVDLSSPPAMTASGGTTSFVEGDNVASTPVAVDSGVTLTDGDTTTARQGTVSITGNFVSGQDVLAFSNTSSTQFGDISGAYSSTTGVMTLTSASGTATIAQWQNAFRAVTYTDLVVTPNTATRTVSFALTSDSYFSSSNTVTKNVSVTGTDQTPIVHTTGGTTSYIGGTSATTIDGGISVSDSDNTTQTSGTVSITSGFHSGDTLAFTNTSSASFGNISASYNSATGVLVLTSAGATATDAQWAHALSSVTFSSTSTTYGNRTVSFSTSDGTSTSAAATDAVDVLNPAPVVTTDSGSAAFVAGDNSASTPVAIDVGLTVADPAGSTLASATAAITGSFHSGEDVLAFTNNGSTMGNIVGSYDAGTGVLTLTSSGATATLAQWQSALRAVTYTDTAVTPNSATRTVSFTAVDANSNTSNAATRTVTVTDTDQTPIVTTTGGTMTYIGGTAATTIDGGISVSDLDNTTQSSATVAISSGFHSGDTLGFASDAVLFGNIAGSYNSATGVMTLTSAGATATDAQWANALSSVTFSSTSTTYGNRTVSFATNDGTKTSTAVTDTVNVLAPPKIITDSGSAAFVSGDNTTSTPVALDSGLTVTDGSSSTLASVTVAITGNFHSGEDVLAFTNDGSTMGNITGSYNAGTGVLTLTSSGASATLAQWQSALQGVTYTDTAVTPNSATRTISFTAVDGGGTTSNTATRTVTVTDTDQTPIVTTTGGTTSYVGGTAPTTIDGGISVSDLDNTTQSLGTVAITSGFHSGDTLGFTNTSSALFGNIVGSYNSASGVMTLTSAGGTATDAQWANALSSVTFSSTSATYGNRTVSFATSDGTKTSTARTDTVAVQAPPTITTDSGSAAFVAGDNTTSTPVALDSGLTVTDGSSSTLASVTVAITGNFHSGEDVLAFTNDGSTMGNITGSYNAATGVLTLTSSGASATLAQWQSALHGVTYTDTAVTPNIATRTISFTAVDGGGTTSNTATRTVSVTDTDQTPIVTTTGGTTSYAGGTAPTTIDSGIAVSDLDNTTQSSGTVAITSGFHSGDTLAFTNASSALFGNIVGSYNSATGVLTLTSAGGTATDAQWANALSSVTFSSSSTTYGNRTVSFATSDGTKTSVAATDTVSVLGPPQITADSGAAAFVAADNAVSTPVAIDSGLTVADGASSTLASATVAIAGNFHGGEDVLAFTNNGSTMGNIAGSYNAATGVLTLTSSGATATLAQWQSALQAVTYTDTAVTPNSATRTISFTAADGGGTTSNTATRTVTVTDTDQTPIVTTTGGTRSYVGGTSATTIDSGISVSDLDNTTQPSGTVAITSGFHAGDMLGFTNTSSALFGNIAGSYNSATGVMTLTSSGATATDAQWANALSAVTFSSTSATYGNRTVSFATSDGTKTSVAATDTVSVFGPPQITADSGAAAFVAADNAVSTPVAIDGGLTVTDGASSTLASATIAITGNFRGSEDVLAFTNNGSTMGNIAGSYNATTGVLTLTSSGATATLVQWQSALQTVTYTDTAVTPNSATRTISFTAVDGGGTISNTATRTVTVTDTDQTPIITADSGSASFVGGRNTAATPVVVDSGISVTKGDSAPLASASVAITGNFQSGEDLLQFTNTSSATFGNIAGSYDAGTGVLTLVSSGDSATIAQWQAALRAVTYTDTAVTPNGATRTVSFSISDGVTTSTAATRTVTVTAADQAPIVTTTGGTTIIATTGATTIDSGVTVSDRDSAAQASGTVSISSGFQRGDVLAFMNSSSATYGNIVGSYDASTGVLTLTSSGASATDAQWQNALDAVTFAAGPSARAGNLTVSFAVNDGSQSSVAATKSVQLLATPFRPLTPARVPGPPREAIGAPMSPVTNAGPVPLFVLTELDPQSVPAIVPGIETAMYSDAALDGGLLGISIDGSRTESGIDTPAWLLPMPSWSVTATKSVPYEPTRDGGDRSAHPEAAPTAGNRPAPRSSAVGSKPARPVGKPSLAEQLARHQRALHVSSHQPVPRSHRSA